MRLHLYDIREPIPEAWLERVTPQRRARAQRYMQKEDRLRCLAAGVLLARALDVRSDDDLITDRNGKPALRDGRAQFSLSHSGFYVALAVAERPVGVDVERVRPLDWQVARRCFTALEMDWLSAEPTGEAFCRLWTGKEAILKATGEGLTRDPSSFCVLPPRDGEHSALGRRWRMTWRAFDGHVLCAACEAFAISECVMDRSTS